ncbi:protease modulator HflC [Sphingomonas sp. CGMCC 1.13654]|uniref:Protein HflC n=1 Tax=Sphingomonas chungangi TaxID=2683589 RepID=A0A838L565_9SPHN|nr:protease modulator HflC [Sphingomonas chungangi]MBA2932768.1 protease modulator HflC [Sphingomonas chungangi]MVW56390.1 protease modulator HflC [Sphingomonas chungangi]
MTVARLLRSPIGWAILLILLVLAAASVFTTVGETQQAVIVRMGVPRAVVNLYRADERFGQTGAGLIARLPLLDQVFFVDKRVQMLELDGQPIQTADGGSIAADAYARYRVVDPALFYTATHGDARVFGDTVKPVLGTALRSALGALPVSQLLVPERIPAMRMVRDRLDQATRRFGVRVSEVRLARTILPEGAALDNAIGRMRTDREQQADAIRADGQAEIAHIRADGEAQAAKMYADAFGQDPDFYDFYRAMQSYQKTLADGSTQMILSPNSEYFRQFRTGGKQ